MQVDGLFIIDKPQGLTSHDVVRRLRKLCATRKVGHAGTLDPLATGVLPVAVNGGTRILQFLMETAKTYRATFCLGSATDTQDSLGTVVETASWEHISRQDCETVCTAFSGCIEQLPPMYSAIKKDGVPLYKLAREGKTVDREKRQITIHRLQILDFSPPLVTIEVECSKGTYIRTLIDDMGKSLGSTAHMTALRRTVNCGFRVEQAVTLEALENMSVEERQRAMISMHAALDFLPEVELTDTGLERLGFGIPPEMEHTLSADSLLPGARVRLCSQGVLRAVADFEPERKNEIRGDFRFLRVYPDKPGC